MLSKKKTHTQNTSYHPSHNYARDIIALHKSSVTEAIDDSHTIIRMVSNLLPGQIYCGDVSDIYDFNDFTVHMGNCRITVSFGTINRHSFDLESVIGPSLRQEGVPMFFDHELMVFDIIFSGRYQSKHMAPEEIAKCSVRQRLKTSLEEGAYPYFEERGEDYADISVYVSPDKEAISDFIKLLSVHFKSPDFVMQGHMPVDFYLGLRNVGLEDIRFFRKGGQRNHFHVADSAGVEQIIKLDRQGLTYPRSEDCRKRGYANKNELDILRFLRDQSDPALMHVPQLLNARSVRPGSEEKAIFLRFEPGKTLADRTDDFTIEEYRALTVQLAEVLYTLNEKYKIYHRDINPDNVVVYSDDQTRDPQALEVTLIDFALASFSDDIKKKPFPDVGSHFVLDPRIVKGFTGRRKKYDHRAELYQLGVTLYYALTHEYVTAYDPYTGDGHVVATREPLVDGKGRLLTARHNQVWKEALSGIRLGFEVYMPILEKMTSLTEDYRSTQEAALAIKNVSGKRPPTLLL